MIMGLMDADTLEDGQAAENSSVQCSICLDAVTDAGQRSWAKLRCGHQFHLDCIGSAFNVKNAMECPNCRETERGEWLYASHPFQDSRMDDWLYDEDFFDHGYSELIGVQWCPMGGLAQLHSSFNERMEFSPGTYHDVIGPHFLYSEHGAVSSATHPYIAYVGPVHPSSSNQGRSNVPDTVGFIGHWSSPPVHSEVPTSYAFPTAGTHYQNWEHLSSPFPSSSSSRQIGVVPDQSSIASLPQRAAARTNQDLQRPASYLNPLLAYHSSNARAAPGSSPMTSSVIPPYRSSVARTQDRVQALQAYYQPSSSSSSSQNVQAASAIPPCIPRSSSNQMGSPTLGVPMTAPQPSSSSSSSDTSQTAGFYYFPPGGNFQSPAENHQSALPPPLALGGEFSEREVRWAPVNFVNWPVTGGPSSSSHDFHQRPGS